MHVFPPTSAVRDAPASATTGQVPRPAEALPSYYRQDPNGYLLTIHSRREEVFVNEAIELTKIDTTMTDGMRRMDSMLRVATRANTMLTSPI